MNKKLHLQKLLLLQYFDDNPYRQIQNFLKDGAPKLRINISLLTVGTWGVWRGCGLSEAEKKCNFQIQFTWFESFFFPEAPTQIQAPYLWKNREGVCCLHPSLNLPLILNPKPTWYSFGLSRWSFQRAAEGYSRFRMPSFFDTSTA